jgi:methyl-accepting chemotaxis protein
MKLSIRFKMIILVAALAVAAFAGFGIFLRNSFFMQRFSRGLTGDYINASSRDDFLVFEEFLSSIEASAGISLALGESYYQLRNTLTRAELEEAMPRDYHRAFAEEKNLLGGGAFYEPYAFYPDVYDFHYFSSKPLLPGGIMPDPDKAEWAPSEWEWDVATYDEGWYQAALPKGWDKNKARDKRAYWSDLYIDTSVNALMVSVCLPMYDGDYQSGRRIVGVATVDVSLSTLQKLVKNFPLPTPSSKIAGFSTVNKATFAISGSDSFDINPYPEDSWLEKLSGLEPGGEIREDDVAIDGVSCSLYAMAHDSGIGLAFLIPNDEKFVEVERVRRTNLITVTVVCAAMIAIVGLVIFALSAWILRPLRKMQGGLETISAGNLSKPIQSRGKDEIAEMVRLLNHTRESIRNLVVSIGEKAASISGISDELAERASQSADTIKEINANTQGMKDKAGGQAGSVEATNVAMGRIIENINKLNSSVEEQAASVSRSSASVEQMTRNITSITESIVANEKSVESLSATAEKGNAAIREVSADIADVVKESERLLEINGMISSIASQTNLLAMNAAIEAAHAGEVGRGFAVVADEIRKLAESSSKQAKTVSEVLKKIKSALDGISESTNTALTHFESIDAGIKTVAQQELQIRSAAAENDAGGKDVLDAMTTSNSITQDVRQGSADMLREGQEVLGQGKTLSTLTAELTTSVNELAEDMEKVSGAVKRINEISGKNRESVDELRGEISKFVI